jgi:hypothetical protein
MFPSKIRGGIQMSNKFNTQDLLSEVDNTTSIGYAMGKIVPKLDEDFGVDHNAILQGAVIAQESVKQVPVKQESVKEQETSKTPIFQKLTNVVENKKQNQEEYKMAGMLKAGSMIERINLKVSEEAISDFILAKVEAELAGTPAIVQWKQWDNSRITKIVKSVGSKITNDPILNNMIITNLTGKVNPGNKFTRTPYITIKKDASLVSRVHQHFILDSMELTSASTNLEKLKDKLTTFVATSKYAEDKPAIVLFDEDELATGNIYTFLNIVEIVTALVAEYLEIPVIEVATKFNIAMTSSKEDKALRIQAIRKTV